MPSPEKSGPASHLNYSENQLITQLRQRYGRMNEGVSQWAKIESALKHYRNELAAVVLMEQPAVIEVNERGILVADWVVQSPRADRVFDEEALAAIRKNEAMTPWSNRFNGGTVEDFLKNNPALNLLTPEIHARLVAMDPGIDSLSSSYIHTPKAIREMGKVCVASNQGIETVEALSHDRTRGFRCFVSFPF